MSAEVTPHLGTCCDPDRQRFPFTHAVCGGWWCTCDCHDEPLDQPRLVSDHATHEWEQVGQAVVCCGRVLSHGTLPADATGRALAGESMDWLALRAADDWAVMRRAVLAHRAEELPDAQRPATTRPGDQPAALPSATAESDRSVP